MGGHLTEVAIWTGLTISQFLKSTYLKELQPDHHPVYNMCKSIELKLLSRLRLGLCHPNEYRFNHNFKKELLSCLQRKKIQSILYDFK